MALQYLTCHEMVLSRDPYDCSLSTVSVTLRPEDCDLWQPFLGLPMNVVSCIFNISFDLFSFSIFVFKIFIGVADLEVSRKTLP